MTNGTENNNAVDPNYVAPDPAPMKNLTLGEIRVKVTFNVAKDEQSIYVNRIKRQSAELIDLINASEYLDIKKLQIQLINKLENLIFF